jgi:hypothetical protein
MDQVHSKTMIFKLEEMKPIRMIQNDHRDRVHLEFLLSTKKIVSLSLSLSLSL